MTYEVGLLVRLRSVVLAVFFIGAGIAMIPSYARAQTATNSVTLAWNPSSDPTVIGYRLYYGVVSGAYTNAITLGNVTTATVSNLASGTTYYFVVTAYNESGLESVPSNEVSYTTPSSGNQPPTLNTIANVTVNEDSGVQTVNLSGITSGSPSESQVLSVTATSSNPGLIPHPTVNYVSPNTTGTLSFTPAPDAFGSATITVVVNDGQAANNTVTRTFVITVNPVNDQPTLNTLIGLTINEDAGLQTVNLSGITSGAANEAQTLTVTASSSNTGLIPNPTVSYTSPNTTGSLSFTLVANAFGTATITVTVNDGQPSNNIVVRTFVVTVNAVNDSPTLNAIGNVTISQGAGLQTVNLSGITSGAANETQTLTVTASSSNTGLIPHPTVSYTSPNTTGSLAFTPVSTASGTATITVTVNDGQPSNNIVTRTFVVTVNPVNIPPTVDALSNLTISEDAGLQTVNLSGITSGSPSETQTLTVTASSSNTGLIPNPTVSYTSPSTTGSLSFTPVTNAFGSATITVTVNDGQPSNNIVTRTFVVTVNAVNDAPTLNAISNLAINQGAGLQTVNLSGITSGAGNETQTLTVTASSSNTGLIPHPTVSYTSPNATGSLAFTPVSTAFGTATITVTVNDGQPSNNIVTRTFVVTVNPVNSPPTLNALSNLTINEDAGLQTVNLSGITSGSPSEADTLTVTASSSNTGLIPNPAVSYTSPSTTGSLSFTPVTNAFGSATITVTLNDGQPSNNIVTRTFVVTVNAVNDPPTLNALSNLTIDEDSGPQTVSLSGISSGAANETQTLTVTASSSNTGLIPNPTVSYTSPNTTGSLAFTPVTNAFGTATITVTVNDGQPSNNIVTRTFTVTVNPVNDPPTLNPIANVTLLQNAGAQTVNLSGISFGPANESQTLTISAVSSDPGLIPHPAVNYVSPNSTGTLSFTPAAGLTGTATVSVTVSDGQAVNHSITRTFTVTVNGIQEPTLNPLNDLTISEDSNSQSVSLSGISAGAGNEGQPISVTASSSNTGLIPNPSVTYVSPQSTGSISFKPLTNAFGTAIITVTVNNGLSVSNTISRSFTVIVNPVNDAPTLNALTNITVLEDSGPRTVNLSGISSGASNEVQTLTVTASSSNPGVVPHPTVTYTSPSTTGSIMFTPAPDAFGTATISVTVNDGQATNNTITRTFVVTVTSVNDRPTLDPIEDLVISENAGPQAIPLTGITSGAANENQKLTVKAVSGNTSLIPNPTVSYVSPNSTGALSIRPGVNALGTVTIIVTVDDGHTVSNTISRAFTVTISGRPRISAIPNQVIATNSSTGPIPFTISDSDTPVENLTVSVQSSNPALIPASNVIISGTGTNRNVAVSPVDNAVGVSTITLTVSDGSLSASAEFTVTVQGTPSPPEGLLIIMTHGDGTVTPDLSGQRLESGKEYTLTASPGPGQLFAGWTGSVKSSNPKLKIRGGENLVIEANFVPDPYKQVRGAYNGLFFESDEVRLPSSGSFNITLSAGGTYSGRLQFAKAKYSFKGKLGLDLQATNVIVRKGDVPLMLEFRVGSAEENQVTGTLTDGGWVAGLAGDRSVFHTVTNPAPHAGKYTFLIPGDTSDPSAPAGHGFGTITVAANGQIRFAGSLADNTKVSQGAMLSAHGMWPFYLGLYSGTGCLVSWQKFESDDTKDVGGALSWIKLSSASARHYSGGFDLLRDAVGSQYAATVGSNILDLAEGQVQFLGGNLPNDFANAILIQANKVVNQSSNSLTLTFSTANGTFKGKVTSPDGGKAQSFAGVVFQKWNSGAGYLTGTNQTSQVNIVP